MEVRKWRCANRGAQMEVRKWRFANGGAQKNSERRASVTHATKLVSPNSVL